MVEYQIYAVDAEGALVHAGVRKIRKQFTQRIAERDQREWERDSDRVAAEAPDCPRAFSRRKCVAMFAYPVGKPELCQRFELPARCSTAIPLPH